MATKKPYMVIGGEAMIYLYDDGHYGFLSGMDIDGDGSGGRVDNDKYFQPHTSYKPDLNSILVPGCVLPEIFIQSEPRLFIGCRAKSRNLSNGLWTEEVVYDGGPNDKLGEHSICTARILRVPPSPTSGGTTEPIIYTEIWPDVPAMINGVGYQLRRYNA